MAAHLPPSLPALLVFIDSLPEPRIVMDAGYRIVGANAAWQREYGADAIGRRCFEVSHRIDVPCDQAGESCPLSLARETGLAQRVLHLHHTPHGDEHVDVTITPIPDGGGGIPWFVETLLTVRQASSRPAAQGLVGRSPAFQLLLQRMLRVAPSSSSVLLLGETGTGKELLARAIHEASPRARGPFVAVDCSGLTETLFESELFGYEKGAFTGASYRKLGLVEAASGGTLFLDEIGELPLALQVKLLRLIETGTFRRVGSIETLRADFRLVAATHRNLAALVRSGDFRSDLYYRINVFPLHTPSLAERSEDIPLLAISLLERVDRHPRRKLSPAALEYLMHRRFEGNIRELRNLVERASLYADGPILDLEHFQQADESEAPAPAPARVGKDSFTLHIPLPLDELERHYLCWARRLHKGDMRSLATLLGVSERTLYRKLENLRCSPIPVSPLTDEAK